MQGDSGCMGGTGNMSQCQAQVTDVKEAERGERERETESSKQRCKRTKRKLQLVNFLMGNQYKIVKQEFQH